MSDDHKPTGAEPPDAALPAAPGAPPAAQGAPSEDAETAAALEAHRDDAAARLAGLESALAVAKDQALRALAEAENTRRRAQREIEENAKYAVANFAREMLNVADNLRRALDAIPAEARAADKALDTFAAGVELTERELLAAFERYGVKRIDPTGAPFDHNLHQAVMQVETAGQAAGTVVQVFQAGYTIHGRILRPAMVTVAKAPPPTPAEPDGAVQAAGDVATG